jgi:hypothetical protein
VRDRCFAVAAGTDVEAGIVEAGGVNVIPLTAGRALGKEAVAAERAGVVVVTWLVRLSNPHPELR